jgi:uncharacterized coiled-coil DUF342 family protein
MTTIMEASYSSVTKTSVKPTGTIPSQQQQQPQSQPPSQSQQPQTQAQQQQQQPQQPQQSQQQQQRGPRSPRVEKKTVSGQEETEPTVKERKPVEGERKRIPFPNQAGYEKEVGMIRERIRILRDELSVVKQDLATSTEGIKDTFASKRQEIRQKLDVVREKQKSTDEQRQLVLDKMKEVTQVREKRMESIQAMKAKMPYKSTEEVDRAIRELEQQIEMRTSSLLEEKRLLNEISNLKKAKRNVLDFQDKLDEFERDKQTSSELKNSLKALDNQATVLRRQADGIVQELNGVRKEQDGQYKQFSDKINRRKELIAALDVEHDKLHKLILEIRKKANEHMEKLREDRAKRSEMLRLKKEKIDEEQRSAEVERLKELSSIPPFVEEILKCNALLLYLAPFGKTAAILAASSSSPSPSSSPELIPPTKGANNEPQTTTSSALSSIEGVDKILKKKSDRGIEDEDSPYLNLGKKKEKKATKKPALKNDILRHPLSVIDEFMKISVNPPTTVSDVPRAIQELQTKRDHFQSEQKRIMEERSSSLNQESMMISQAEEMVASATDTLEVIEKELTDLHVQQDIIDIVESGEKTSVID